MPYPDAVALMRIIRVIKIFMGAGEVIQRLATRRANPLSVTSTRSNKRAKNNDSPATIPNPNSMISQPGPGPGTAMRPPNTTSKPPKMLKNPRR